VPRAHATSGRWRRLGGGSAAVANWACCRTCGIFVQQCEKWMIERNTPATSLPPLLAHPIHGTIKARSEAAPSCRRLRAVPCRKCANIVNRTRAHAYSTPELLDRSPDYNTFSSGSLLIRSVSPHMTTGAYTVLIEASWLALAFTASSRLSHPQRSFNPQPSGFLSGYSINVISSASFELHEVSVACQVAP